MKQSSLLQKMNASVAYHFFRTENAGIIYGSTIKFHKFWRQNLAWCVKHAYIKRVYMNDFFPVGYGFYYPTAFVEHVWQMERGCCSVAMIFTGRAKITHWPSTEIWKTINFVHRHIWHWPMDTLEYRQQYIIVRLWKRLTHDNLYLRRLYFRGQL